MAGRQAGSAAARRAGQEASRHHCSSLPAPHAVSLLQAALMPGVLVVEGPSPGAIPLSLVLTAQPTAPVTIR